MLNSFYYYEYIVVLRNINSQYMKPFIVSLLMLTSVYTWAQKTDKALLRIKYDFSHMLDTNKRNDYYKETMLLVTGKDASAFLSYDKVLRDAEAKKSFEEQYKQQGGDIRVMKSPPFKRPLRDTELFYFAKDGKRFIRENFGQVYIVEEKTDKINWNIHKDTLTISGIPCKKATAIYKGRNWIAWFAEELPFVSGPWKLAGLPGLILQAYDDKREVIFDFAGIEKVEEMRIKEKTGEGQFKKLGSSQWLTASEIAVPTEGIKATSAEVNRLKEARAKDPVGFAKTQLANLGFGGITPVSTGTPTAANHTIQTVNNPIEK